MAQKKVSEQVKEQVREAVLRGNVVIIHPAAKKKFKGQKVVTVEYPK